MNAKLIIGLALIAGFMGLGVYTFIGSQVANVSITSARRAQQTVQVQGVIDFETANYEVENK
ncbi:MAG: hypothetical protein ACE5GA_10230, partial [Candidatus Zixiibacteriota bacterium]